MIGYRDQYHFEPLRIRAWLRTPVVADRQLPLDGILLYQAHRDKYGPQIATVPGEYSCDGISTLPLDIVHLGRKNWYYCCSWAQWAQDVEGCDYWNKRFDADLASLIDFGGRRGRINIGEGKYKAYHMPIFYRAALWVEWYCVGDKAEIEHLLATATHLGKKAVQGWGRVMRWEIESLDEDWSIVHDGKLMRGVPVEDAQKLGVEFDLMYCGIRPSYWKADNQMWLAVPPAALRQAARLVSVGEVGS